MTFFQGYQRHIRAKSKVHTESGPTIQNTHWSRSRFVPTSIFSRDLSVREIKLKDPHSASLWGLKLSLVVPLVSLVTACGSQLAL